VKNWCSHLFHSVIVVLTVFAASHTVPAVAAYATPKAYAFPVYEPTGSTFLSTIKQAASACLKSMQKVPASTWINLGEAATSAALDTWSIWHRTQQQNGIRQHSQSQLNQTDTANGTPLKQHLHQTFERIRECAQQMQSDTQNNPGLTQARPQSAPHVVEEENAENPQARTQSTGFEAYKQVYRKQQQAIMQYKKDIELASIKLRTSNRENQRIMRQLQAQYADDQEIVSMVGQYQTIWDYVYKISINIDQMIQVMMVQLSQNN